MREEAGYVHGYTGREEHRLQDQAQTLADLLHHDTTYCVGEKVLEAGCGTGAQTLILASNNPLSSFTCIDRSASSVRRARDQSRLLGLGNTDFRVADIYCLPFGDHSFDHAFVCFLFEHLKNPLGATRELMRVVKPGGTITVIEGDHGSAYFFPHCSESQKAIDALVTVQARLGGNALIGRQLYPLLSSAGLLNVTVSPRMVYVDKTKPLLVQGFIRDTFTAMVQGVQKAAISAGLLTEEHWEKAIQGLVRTMEQDGVFCYTFFKAKGVNP